jgi:hypothetical protein
VGLCRAKRGVYIKAWNKLADLTHYSTSPAEQTKPKREKTPRQSGHRSVQSALSSHSQKKLNAEHNDQQA